MAKSPPAPPVVAESFESAMSELESIVQGMEGGKLTLEQSLARYMIIDASWNDASDAWYEAFDRTLRETKAEASVIATELRGRVDAAEPSARWVYQLLLLRAEELGYHEGPFD